jgi:hypothetical protein
MPASQRNKNRGAEPPAYDPALWRRQLEQSRLASAATAAAEEAAVSERAEEPAIEPSEYLRPSFAYSSPPIYDEDRDAPDVWKRQLEHGRLSAMSLEQSLLFQGPGAAGAGDDEQQQQMALQMMMMAQAAAAEEEKKKQKMPLGDITKKLVKAQMVKKLKETFQNLCTDWLACWIFCPATFFLFIHFNNDLKKTASLYKEESKKRAGPLPGEDQKLKQYLQNITIYLAVEWMNWACLTAFWYGLLMLVLILLYVIYKLIKCGITLGISC